MTDISLWGNGYQFSYHCCFQQEFKTSYINGFTMSRFVTIEKRLGTIRDVILWTNVENNMKGASDKWGSSEEIRILIIRNWKLISLLMIMARLTVSIQETCDIHLWLVEKQFFSDFGFLSPLIVITLSHGRFFPGLLSKVITRVYNLIVSFLYITFSF